MTVRICFSAGSLAGQTFELAAGSSLSLGRSRTCDIKASEPDVSGRHLVFRRGAGAGVTVEVASSRKTLFNGTSVSMSDSFPVKNGDTFRCGGELVCRVECDDEDATVPPPVATAPSASGENDKTVFPGGTHQAQTVRPMASEQTAAAVSRQTVVPPPKTGSVSESNSTIAIQTRIASDEELEDIRRAYRARRTRRTLSIIGPALMFLAAALGAWIWFRPKTEEFVSWPETPDGRSMDRNVIVAPYLALTVPDSSNCRVEKSEDGADICSVALGNYRRRHSYPSVAAGSEMFVAMNRHGEFSVSPCLYLVRRDALVESGVRFAEGVLHEDNVFTLSLLLSLERVGHVSRLLYERWVHPGSTMTSASAERHIRGYLFCIEWVDDRLRERVLPHDVLHELKRCRVGYRHAVRSLALKARLPPPVDYPLAEKLENLVRCLKDRGLVYTIGRMFFGRR